MGHKLNNLIKAVNAILQILSLGAYVLLYFTSPTSLVVNMSIWYPVVIIFTLVLYKVKYNLIILGIHLLVVLRIFLIMPEYQITVARGMVLKEIGERVKELFKDAVVTARVSGDLFSITLRIDGGKTSIEA